MGLSPIRSIALTQLVSMTNTLIYGGLAIGLIVGLNGIASRIKNTLRRRELRGAIQMEAIRAKNLAATEGSALAYLGHKVAHSLHPAERPGSVLTQLAASLVILPLADTSDLDGKSVLMEACAIEGEPLAESTWRYVSAAYANLTHSAKMELLWTAAEQLQLPRELICRLIADSALVGELRVLRNGRSSELLQRRAQHLLDGLQAAGL